MSVNGCTKVVVVIWPADRIMNDDRPADPVRVLQSAMPRSGPVM